MSPDFLSAVLDIAQLLLALAMVFALYRMVRGPRAQDRILALDTLYVNAMLVILSFGIESGTAVFFEAALLIGVLGFVSTVAAAKFLLRGEVIE